MFLSSAQDEEFKPRSLTECLTHKYSCILWEWLPENSYFLSILTFAPAVIWLEQKLVKNSTCEFYIFHLPANLKYIKSSHTTKHCLAETRSGFWWLAIQALQQPINSQRLNIGNSNNHWSLHYSYMDRRQGIMLVHHIYEQKWKTWMNTEYIDIQFSFPAFLELTPMIIFLPPPGSRQMHPAFNFISTNSFSEENLFANHSFTFHFWSNLYKSFISAKSSAR